MKRIFALSILTFALVGCVDSEGISPELSSGVHPSTSENAVVMVTEYGDLQCPACRAAYSMLAEPLVQKYGTQIGFEFKHFPLSSIHPLAMPAAEASECAADQGKFWEFIGITYTRQEELSMDALDTWGQELGLDMDLYSRCRRSHVKRGAITDSYDAGREAGVSGTPTFFVNGQQTEATIESLSAAIDQALGAGAAL
jgi:protein-disulfide isomerase